MCDCYFTIYLTQRSRFEVLLTAVSECFTHDARTFVLTVPQRRRAFTVSWNVNVFVHSSVVIFFFDQAPSSLDSSTSLSPPSFPVALAFNQTKPLSPFLDRRRHDQKPLNVQLIPITSLCRI